MSEFTPATSRLSELHYIVGRLSYGGAIDDAEDHRFESHVLSEESAEQVVWEDFCLLYRSGIKSQRCFLFDWIGKIIPEEHAP